MGENKGQTIFLSVIGIATLLVAIIGATFAYFTTTINNPTETATGTLTAAKISNVVLTGTNVQMTDVLPGYEHPTPLTMTVAFKDAVTPGFEVPYTCEIEKSNDLPNMQYSFKEEETSYSVWTDFDNTNKATIASKNLTSQNTSDKYYVKVRFQETGTDQTTAANNKTGVVTVSCALADSNVYYTDSFKTGTTTAPSTQATTAPSN